uniref:Tumour necrosis factor receptor 13C TALL-1 binding domain-containing protein n=1 Tax=Oryctolagus cuniculus TaxID=9986 RepID=G1T4W9_RABIT
MRRGGRSRRGRDGPAPTSCVQAQCFDPLTRHCVACYLLHMQESRPGKRGPTLREGGRPAPEPDLPGTRGVTADGGVSGQSLGGDWRSLRGPHPLSLPSASRCPLPCPVSPPSDLHRPRSSLPSVPCPPSPSPPPAAGASSLAPGTALQPQESVGTGIPDGALPLPGLLFGAPVLLGLALALALALLALVSWKRRRRWPGVPSPEARDGDQEESLDDVIVFSPGCPDATAPNSPPPGEEAGTAPPSHSIPVPATELGSTELVTTKTAGPEQQ